MNPSKTRANQPAFSTPAPIFRHSNRLPYHDCIPPALRTKVAATERTSRSQTVASHSAPRIDRRAALSLLAVSALSSLIPPSPSNAQYEKLPFEKYDANKTRRYVGIGRPPPDRPPPKFDASKTVFSIDDTLQAQDLGAGKGDTDVEPGCLVVARWNILLDDGTTVDDTNERKAAMFRPGAHQVPPGIEDAVVGMKSGGVRRVKGSAERVLSNVSTGYDIGERSLVPNGSNVFIEITVDAINPYGT